MFINVLLIVQNIQENLQCGIKEFVVLAHIKMAETEKTTINPLDLKDCPVNKSEGIDDPNNVFTCKKWEKCCTYNLDPACCADPEITDAM